MTAFGASAPARPAVRIEGLFKSFGDLEVLRGIDLAVAEHEVICLIGASGSGKSTLLRCIAGIYQPDAGRVKVSGRISTLLELGAGFHPDLSGRENVYLNATILGMGRKEIDRVFDDIVAFAGVEQFIDSPVKVYSSGMYVRLGFSVAVHVRPEILIIDEVIAVGDEQFQRRCFEHLYSLRKEGVTIVVVTHGMATVQTMCDQAAWLDHGVVQQIGPAPAVSLAYLQRVNRAEAEHPGAMLLPDEDGVMAEVEPHPRGDSIVEDGDHWGSGEIRITAVEFVGDSGRPTEVIPQGSPLRVRIGYSTTGTHDNPTFGIAIHAEGGVHVAGANTRLSGCPTGEITGTGWVEFSTDHLPLLDGSYLISVAVEDRYSQHTYDRYDQAWHLRIRHDGEQAVAGLVDVGGSWRVLPGSAGD